MRDNKFIFETGYYKLNRIELCLCGAWPEQSLKMAYTIRIITFTIIISLFIPECLHTYNNWGNLSEMISVAPSGAVLLIMLAKYFFLIGQTNMISQIVEQIQNDWKLFDKIPAIKKEMHRFAKNGYNFTLFYAYYILSVTCIYSGTSFIPLIMDVIIPLNETREKTLPFPTNYVIIDSEKHFISIGFHGFIATCIGVIYIFTADALIMIVVYHCCSLFKIIGIILEKLDEKNFNYNDEEYEKKITQAIIVHQYAIRFSEFIEKSVTKLYGFVFLINMIEMSITGFYSVLVFQERKNEAIRMIILTMGQFIHLYFNSIPSQELTNNSENVLNAIYDCQWIKLSKKSKSLLCIMLLRSSRPQGFTAGKFYPINMENFSKIIKTSMSYFTVLKSMQ